MIHPQTHRNSWKKIGIPPCETLFIYYLKGRLELSDQKFHNSFIGNWEEEDDSILFFSASADQQIENLLHRRPQLEYVDNYRMPYDQWLGEKFTAFEHGAFRIMPPWEVTEDHVNSCQRTIYPFRSDAQRSETYCQHPSKVSGQNTKTMDAGRHLAYNLWQGGARLILM